MTKRISKKLETYQEVPIEYKQYKSIKPLNNEQDNYIKKIVQNDITICLGRSGSGKTAIACGIAAEWLARNLIDKIIISRPAIGAEDLGYLPGLISEKLNPYLAPLYTELSPFLNIKNAIAEEKLIILPVSYMRGITFKNAFVLVDEVQNLDYRQIKLILTRFGTESKLVMTGDTTQSDLAYKKVNDFSRVIDKLKVVADNPDNKVAIVELFKSVRHPLIEVLLSALEE